MYNFTDSHLTQYILQRLLGSSNTDSSSNRQSERLAAEKRIFSEGGTSVVYPQAIATDENPIRRYLDEAKEQIDVIDFRRPR